MNDNTEKVKNNAEENKDNPSSSAEAKEKNSYTAKMFLNDVTEVVETVFLFLLFFLLIRTYVFEQAIVDGDSMVPTLLDKQKLIYSKIFEPENGDIVIADNDKLDLIVKRVIATEGQTLDIIDGKVYVDGEEVNEQIYKGQGDILKADYFVNSETEKRAYNTELQYPVTIPEGCVFLMGDNRYLSEDSRGYVVGFVRKEELIGEVILRYSPFDKFTFF